VHGGHGGERGSWKSEEGKLTAESAEVARRTGREAGGERGMGWRAPETYEVRITQE
jgi:hypothetical protein